MRKIKLHLLFFAFIMIVGLLGRIIDGSQVLPPNAPFSSPFETHLSAAPSHAVVTTSTGKESKASGHAVQAGDRPWFGIIETVFIDRSSLPSSSLPVLSSEEPLSADDPSSGRPPSPSA